jgi:hypothetical protein
MRTLLRQRFAVIALLLAAFAVIPVADAFLCASEGGDTYSHVESHSDDGSGSESAADSDHGACSHGHCHHAYAHVASHAAPETALPPPLLQRPNSVTVASHTPDGLKRPPKA